MSDALAATLAAELASRYVVEGELGRGSSATVYLARDLRHGRRVALKLLHAALGEVLGVERFQREIRTQARLQHPHILPLFDSGQAGGRLFYTMPYVEAGSLRDRLRREGRLIAERGWSYYTLFDVTYHPDRMTVAELEDGFRRVVRAVFSLEASRRRDALRKQIWRNHPRF